MISRETVTLPAFAVAPAPVYYHHYRYSYYGGRRAHRETAERIGIGAAGAQ